MRWHLGSYTFTRYRDGYWQTKRSLTQRRDTDTILKVCKRRYNEMYVCVCAKQYYHNTSPKIWGGGGITPSSIYTLVVAANHGPTFQTRHTFFLSLDSRLSTWKIFLMGHSKSFTLLDGYNELLQMTNQHQPQFVQLSPKSQHTVKKLTILIIVLHV